MESVRDVRLRVGKLAVICTRITRICWNQRTRIGGDPLAVRISRNDNNIILLYIYLSITFVLYLFAIPFIYYVMRNNNNSHSHYKQQIREGHKSRSQWLMFVEISYPEFSQSEKRKRVRSNPLSICTSNLNISSHLPFDLIPSRSTFYYFISRNSLGTLINIPGIENKSNIPNNNNIPPSTRTTTTETNSNLGATPSKPNSNLNSNNNSKTNTPLSTETSIPMNTSKVPLIDATTDDIVMETIPEPSQQIQPPPHPQPQPKHKS